MWNNFINPRELPYLFQRLRREPALARMVLSRLPLTGRGRVRAAWAHTESVAKQWWDIPAVVERWNRMISGDPSVGPCPYVMGKYLRGRERLRGLSLGCGGGTKEMEWVAGGAFAAMDAYDLSERRILDARTEAARRGLGESIRFHVGDVYAIRMDDDVYDVIIADNALHHLTPLEPLMRRIHDSLAPDGTFFVNEFIGPSRFQWTDRQIDAANKLLSLLPARYRMLVGSRHARLPVIRPSRLGMILKDPSEAVESSRIMPLLHEVFDVREVRGYGGAILHLLFAGIAHHFVAPDEEGLRLLETCFAAEDALLKSGEVGHDFVVAVCGKRRNAAVPSAAGLPAR